MMSLSHTLQKYKLSLIKLIRDRKRGISVGVINRDRIAVVRISVESIVSIIGHIVDLVIEETCLLTLE